MGISMGFILTLPIYPYILDNEEEKKFRRTFLKEELLRIFQTGQRHIQLGYRFRKGKYITCYTVNIEMFEHPVDHTVECCAIWRNDTIPYINRVMTHMLLRDKYRMIAVYAGKYSICPKTYV